MIIVSFYLPGNDIGQAGIVYQIDGTGNFIIILTWFILWAATYKKYR